MLKSSNRTVIVLQEQRAFVSSKAIPTAAAMRQAVAQYRQATASAELTLKAAYETAVSDYTKAGRFDDAEMIRHAVGQRFSPETSAGNRNGPTTVPGRPETIDLLKTIDVRRDTIRKGWVMQDGVLQPTRWDDDHGPFIKIPVSVKGSYELHVRFRLAVAAEALYVHVPVGSKWGLLVLTSATQDFANVQGRGEIYGFVTIPLQSDADGVFRVSCTADGSVNLGLSINNQESFMWTGDGQSVVYDVTYGAWTIRVVLLLTRNQR